MAAAGYIQFPDKEFGRLYSWCPEYIVIECDTYGKTTTLKRPDLIDTGLDRECGRDHTVRIQEEVVNKLLNEAYEPHHHPWRYRHTTKDCGIPFYISWEVTSFRKFSH